MLLQVCPTRGISFVDKGTSVSGHLVAHISDQITQLKSKICQAYHVIPRSWVYRFQLQCQFFFPGKKDFKDGSIDSNNSLCFTDFSVVARTLRFVASRFTTVWDLHSKWYGRWSEPRDSPIKSSIFRFFKTESVIIASVFSHKSAGVMFSCLSTDAATDNLEYVSTSNSAICLRSSYGQRTYSSPLEK